MKKVFLTLQLLFLPLTASAASGLGLVNPNHPIQGYDPSLIQHQVQAQGPVVTDETMAFCYAHVKQIIEFGDAHKAAADFEKFMADNPQADEKYPWYREMVLGLIAEWYKGPVTEEHAQEVYNKCLQEAKLGDLI